MALAHAAHAAGSDVPTAEPVPERPWSASLGAGLSKTGGNSDASSYNLSFSVAYDPKRRNRLHAEGLYLRSDEDGRTTADKTTAAVRDEYRLGRAFVFAEVRYQRDVLKQVGHLISPLTGAGYRLLDRSGIRLAVDGSFGAAFERLSGRGATTNLALQAGQRLEWRASPSLKLEQRLSGLWKARDVSDAYYHLELSAALTVARRLELKLTFADDYKSRPAAAGLRRNDTSFVAALVFRI